MKTRIEGTIITSESGKLLHIEGNFKDGLLGFRDDEAFFTGRGVCYVSQRQFGYLDDEEYPPLTADELMSEGLCETRLSMLDKATFFAERLSRCVNGLYGSTFEKFVIYLAEYAYTNVKTGVGMMDMFRQLPLRKIYMEWKREN